MAAPSGTVWGSIVGSYGRVGIHVSLTHTNTHTTRVITLWFWSKYSVSDSTNTLYYDAGTTSATSSKGSVSISTSVSSGSGWSTSNQVKLKTYSHTYARGTSDWGESCAMKLTGIDRVGGTMTATTSYTVPKLASYTVAYNANGGSGAPSSQTKYYGKTLTLSNTKPTRPGHIFQGWATSSGGNVSYAAGASYTANAAVTLYAKWKAETYTVSYNGNESGVTNVPSSQTKTYGVALTLSSQKPIKTGYTFQGWATSPGGNVSYAAGVSYTANTGVTLYAKWKVNTYTVLYDANGGSGAPSSQTKNYGQALTLSSVTPTKPNYNFLGWGTSSTATTVSYKAGASYTANAGITLYAIWQLAYTKPRISSLSVYRCDEERNVSDDGTSVKVTFDWATDKDVTAVTIEYKASTATDWTIAPLSETTSGTSGSIDEKIDNISVDSSYDVRITVADGETDAYKTTISRSVAGAVYPIDFLKGGNGTAIGKVADKEGFECDFDSYFNKPLTSTTLLGQNVSGYSSSKIIIFPEINYSSLNTLYGTTGTADTTYFTNLLRWICDNYPSKQHYIYIGKANPNSVGVAIISIYDTSNKNATTGLPQYASGIYVRLSNAPINFGTSSYTFYSNTTISSASGVATSATKVNTNLVIKLNSGTTEGTNMFTFNGSAAKTINITPSAIGAAASSHTHSYLPLSGGTVTGNLTINSPTLTLNTTNTITSARSLRFANAKYVTGTNTSGTAYDVAGLSSANTINLGHASLTTVIRGSSVRLGSGSGTVVTSDQNLKTDIQDIDEKYIAFFKQLQPKTYKYKLGNAKRPHIGFIAQEVEQALLDSGLTNDDFAGICIEEVKYAEENDYDEHDDMNWAYKQGLKQIYELRYEEFISLNTRMVQNLMKENEALKDKAEEQQQEIDNLKEENKQIKEEMQQLKELVAKLVS